MKKILQNPTHTLSCLLFLTGAVFLAYLTYSNLDKGFIFNDEAYYLSYYRNKGESLSFDRTNFFRIFKFLYTPNIYHFRIISITALVLSNFLLCFTVFKYVNFKKNIFFLSFLGVFIGFNSWQINNLIIQQYIGNTILINIGVSLLLFFLLSKKQIFNTLSGFVLSFVLFNGNSHSIVIIPILTFFMVSNLKHWKINLVYFFTGYMVGVIIYFTFLDTLDNFIYQFKFLKEYLSFHKKQHSKTFMVLWCVYLFLNAILPSAITVFFMWKSKFSEKSVAVLDRIIAVIGIITLGLFIFSSQYYIFAFIVFTHLLAVRFWFAKDQPKESKYLILLLLIIPYCLAFGSQTWFHLRLNAYIFYYFLLIFICITKLYKNSIWNLAYLAAITSIIISFPNILHDKGWKDFIFTEQTEKVKINGYDLYLDKRRKKDIEDLRPYLQNQPNVIYSSNHLMGYLYILNASPPIYYYFTLKDYISFIIKKVNKTPDDFIYIESDDYPFYPKEIVPLKFVSHPENYKTVKTGRFTLYLPSNYQKK
ncbi:hypothetical protein SAMN05421664_1291 [Chryseobacterium soldanellicola]|uniref:Dolichyl-phosphate-mannose-protein mannosyltransferase n=1 Tax=Chryseobacterium soldanellicola TaxID=311333 RepID=A0A1H1A888_9FLAO|nr:hypothetical protein [Chryseobacterium soldanellicola]SDQ35556.1 hypothetical protein SAMN05421664_1291 [Chryseobacterium soldanellicola]